MSAKLVTVMGSYSTDIMISCKWLTRACFISLTPNR